MGFMDGGNFLQITANRRGGYLAVVWRLAVQASSIALRGSCGGCIGGLGHLRRRKLFPELCDSHSCAVPQCHILKGYGTVARAAACQCQK